MMKIIIAVLLAAPGSAFAADKTLDLNKLNAADVKAAMAEIIVPVAEPALKVMPSSKIRVTPVTEHWPNTFLVNFNRGTDIDTVMYVLKKEGLVSDKFADNGYGFCVRIDLDDEEASFKAQRLAGYAVVKTVEVNRNVFNLISGLKANETGTGAETGAPRQ